MSETRLRSPLGRAIGLGSAKEGVQHWWMQRVTAIVLVPLVLWLVIAVIGLAGAERGAIVTWLHNPLPAVLMLVLLLAIFYHTALGLQVIIEDYIHSEAVKLAALIALRVLCVLFALRSVLAVLKLALGA